MITTCYFPRGEHRADTTFCSRGTCSTWARRCWLRARCFCMQPALTAPYRLTFATARKLRPTATALLPNVCYAIYPTTYAAMHVGKGGREKGKRKQIQLEFAQNLRKSLRGLKLSASQCVFTMYYHNLNRERLNNAKTQQNCFVC